MADRKEKLSVLSKIAGEFNRQALFWAVGSSVMLYYRGLVQDFHDIDLFVAEDSATEACRILESLGEFCGSPKSPQYSSAVYRQYRVDGVDIDLIAGFGIVDGGVNYDCSLKKSDISDTVTEGGETVPLMALPLWGRYYTLMHRPGKAALIQSALESADGR